MNRKKRPIRHGPMVKREIRLPAIILAATLLAMTACSGKEPGQKPPERPADPEPEIITRTFDHPDCTIDGEPCVHLYFSWPDFTGDSPIADTLRSWAERMLFYPEPGAEPTGADSLAGEWFRDYDSYSRQIEGYRLPWSLERSVGKIFESENLITLHFNEFSFSGGAHPQQVDRFRSFIKPQGHPLTLADLTYDYPSYQQLVALAEEHFRFSFELLESENLADAGFHFLDGQFHLTDNFAFTEYGLLFFFNAYEVAPYATGPIAIELPYDDLEHLIRSRWLFQRTNLAL